MKKPEVALRKELLVAIVIVVLGGLLFIAGAFKATPTDAALLLTGVPTATGTPVPAYLPVILRQMPTPTATSIPVPGWLAHVNQFRALANLPALTENSGWSFGGELHSKYMVMEDEITHYENSGSSWYTAEGDQAGRNGNIFVSSSTSTTDERAIDFWMAAPFHAVGIIDPELQATGFGSYRASNGGWQMGATLDVNRGRGGLPGGITFPIPFPQNGGGTWLTSFYGGEWPDPLPGCPGYTAPTGPPVILQLGSGGVTPNVTAHSFREGSTNLEHCVFDETNFTHPDGTQQNTGRIVLGIRDAVVILPRAPLSVGHSYTASITDNGTTYTWTFSVVSAPTTNLAGVAEAIRMEAR